MATGTPLGTRIRKRRQVLHLTQEDLAARLSVSKSTVANWERGKHFPQRYLGAVEAILGPLEDEEPRPVTREDLRAKLSRIEQLVAELSTDLDRQQAEEETEAQRRRPA